MGRISCRWSRRVAEADRARNRASNIRNNRRGRSLLAHAASIVSRDPCIDAVQVVIGEGQENVAIVLLVRRSYPSPPRRSRRRGTRRESVRNGLEALDGGDRADPRRRAALLPGAVSTGCSTRSMSTTAPSRASVVDTLRARRRLGEPSTAKDRAGSRRPRLSGFEAIRAPIRLAGGEATDDAQVARAAGLASPGRGRCAREAHTADDFPRRGARRAPATAQRPGLRRPRLRRARPSGWAGRHPARRGLAGHSDADVVLHAVTDALAGRARRGRYRRHFPPSRPAVAGRAL